MIAPKGKVSLYWYCGRLDNMVVVGVIRGNMAGKGWIACLMIKSSHETITTRDWLSGNAHSSVKIHWGKFCVHDGKCSWIVRGFKIYSVSREANVIRIEKKYISGKLFIDPVIPSWIMHPRLMVDNDVSELMISFGKSKDWKKTGQQRKQRLT